MRVLKVNYIIVFLFSTIVLFAKKNERNASATFTNPVIHGDIADPSIIRIEDNYYASGTSSEWAPYYPLFSSKDLINWKQVGHVFTQKPEWTSNSFWAPELYYHNNKIFCYYTARNKSNGVSSIGVASTDSPDKEFTDHGIIIEHGKEAIDAYVFNDNGQLYISWKAYGLEFRPIEILASKLSDDGLKLIGEPFTLLKDDDRIGMEGQAHFKHGDYYYIVYAVRGCCGFNSDYEVHVARARKFEGPYEKYKVNPILKAGNNDFISIGHGTIVETRDNRLFYMCHAYKNGDERFCGRQPVLYEMYVDNNNWLVFKDGNNAISTVDLPFPNTRQSELKDFEDNFNSKKLNVNWTWNYPYCDVEIKLKNKQLYLSGKPIGDNKYGAALCVRPQSANYEFQTQVINDLSCVKGLTFYGDKNNLVVWGVDNGKIVLKSVKDKVESVIFSLPINAKKVFLKINVRNGIKLDFFYSEDGKNWKPAKSDQNNIENVMPWDRVARPGLIHIGDYNEPAIFNYFKLYNL